MQGLDKTIINNVIWKFAERILAQGVSLVVSIILARILLPTDYGTISMVMVFIVIANVFVTEGIPSALIQKADADRLDFSSVFILNFILSIVIYITLFISAPFISNFYSNKLLTPVIHVLGIRIIIASFNSVQHAYVSRHMLFKKYFWSTLFGTLLSGVVGIVLAYRDFGVWALVVQYMVNTSIDTMVLFVTVKWRPSLEFSIVRVKKLFRFVWRMLFEGLTNNLVLEFKKLLIGKVYSSSDLAYYTKGDQFPSLIVTNFSTSIGAVLFPVIANIQDDKQRVLSMMRKTVKITSFIIYPMLVGLAVVAKPFINVVLTEKWSDTVPYLQAFCLLYAPTVGLIPRHQALNGTGRSDVYMYEHIIYRVIAVVILLLTYKISVYAIVIGSLISSAVICLIVAFTSHKYNNYKYSDQLNDILPILIVCFIMGCIVYLISFIGFSDLYTLIIQIVVGIITYIFLSKIFHLEGLDVCKKYIYEYVTKNKN